MFPITDPDSISQTFLDNPMSLYALNEDWVIISGQVVSHSIFLEFNYK